MARAALQWSIDDLREAASVGRMTVHRFESGETVSLESIEAIRGALIEAGAQFLQRSGRVGVTVPE
jgi:transcriptional regulator with XRE-family HTH domain